MNAGPVVEGIDGGLDAGLDVGDLLEVGRGIDAGLELPRKALRARLEGAQSVVELIDSLPQQRRAITQDTTRLEVPASKPFLDRGQPFPPALAVCRQIAAIALVEAVGGRSAMLRESTQDDTDVVFDLLLCIKQSALAGTLDLVEISERMGCVMVSVGRIRVLAHVGELFDADPHGREFAANAVLLLFERIEFLHERRISPLAVGLNPRELVLEPAHVGLDGLHLCEIGRALRPLGLKPHVILRDDRDILTNSVDRRSKGGDCSLETGKRVGIDAFGGKAAMTLRLESLEFGRQFRPLPLDGRFDRGELASLGFFNCVQGLLAGCCVLADGAIEGSLHLLDFELERLLLRGDIAALFFGLLLRSRAAFLDLSFQGLLLTG